MLWPINEMARVYAGMQLAIASGERIYSLLDSEPEIIDKALHAAQLSQSLVATS